VVAQIGGFWAEALLLTLAIAEPALRAPAGDVLPNVRWLRSGAPMDSGRAREDRWKCGPGASGGMSRAILICTQALPGYVTTTGATAMGGAALRFFVVSSPRL
jgi:hypothetical protein